VVKKSLVRTHQGHYNLWLELVKNTILKTDVITYFWIILRISKKDTIPEIFYKLKHSNTNNTITMEISKIFNFYTYKFIC
jgi:hypothetical protein